jgi:uncharacterized protein YdhG (YjbR/CyaY superfamily)
MKSETYKDIDEYINSQSAEIREILAEMRATIKKFAPEAEEKISYQIPTYYLHGNLVHFAACKNHVGFYPGPSGLKAFPEEVASYKCTKGAVQFPYDKPLPLKLIKNIVRFRVKENMERKAPKSKQTQTGKVKPVKSRTIKSK